MLWLELVHARRVGCGRMGQEDLPMLLVKGGWGKASRGEGDAEIEGKRPCAKYVCEGQEEGVSVGGCVGWWESA